MTSHGQATHRGRRWGAVRAALIGAIVAGTCTSSFAQNEAVVNGTAIPASRVEAFVKAMVAQGRPDNEQLRQAVREELIARELFVQEARKRDLHKQDEVDNQLIRARQDILIGALIRDTLAKNPVTDDQIEAEYKRLTAEKAAAKEYKARHILVEEEAQAIDIIASLDKGGDFAELAKVSKDPGSAARGGDLDWNPPDTFVPEFSAAMTGLEKGKYTPKPIKTQFGYHVILLEDTRSAQPPAIDSLRPQIKQQLERETVVELQNSLRNNAKIE
ncbi:MAG: peptidylprolyl isomerase [Burkholderiaceae bacterium]